MASLTLSACFVIILTAKHICFRFVFSIYLHLLGLLFTVIFIGFVTVLMLGQMMPKFEFEKTMKESCAYMKQRKIPKDLRKRIQRFYQYSWANQQFQNLDEKHVLRFLPLSVRQEIELHSNLAALKQVTFPIFDVCTKLDHGLTLVYTSSSRRR